MTIWRAAGIPLLKLTPAEVAAGCSAFQNEAMQGGLVHLGAGDLNGAIRHAEIRRNGEVWAFSARASSTDITPLLAVVLAAIPVRRGDSKPFRLFSSSFSG